MSDESEKQLVGVLSGHRLSHGRYSAKAHLPAHVLRFHSRRRVFANAIRACLRSLRNFLWE